MLTLFMKTYLINVPGLNASEVAALGTCGSYGWSELKCAICRLPIERWLTVDLRWYF